MRTSEYIKKYDLKTGFALKSHEPFLEDFYFDFQSNVEIQYDTVSEFTELKFWDMVSTFREKFESIFNKCPMSYPEHIWDKFRDKYVPVVLFDFFPQIKKDVEKIKDMDYITLYKYMFVILSMRDIFPDKYKYIPRPTKSSHYMGIFVHDDEEKWTDSPDEHFLESIIKICDELLDFQLYYVEQIACEKFLEWSENKLNHVRNINNKKKQDQEQNRRSFNDFFNFFWYEQFKRKMVDDMKNFQMTVYFEKLGIPMTKNEETIKSVYKELAKKYHPDIIGNTKENHERMVDINEAKTKCLMYCKS